VVNIYSISIYADSPIWWDKDSILIKKSIYYLTYQDYNRVDSLYNILIKKYPNDPIGYYLKTLLYGAIMLDYASNFKEKDMLYYMRITDSLAKLYKNDAWKEYYLGAIKIVKGAYMIDNDQLKGILYAFDGIENIKRSINIDSTLYDAYYYLGFYYYGKGKIGEKLWWLGIREKTNKKKAIYLLRKAIDNSLFSKEMAIHTLIGIYIEEGDYKIAEAIIKKGYENNNRDRLYLWDFIKLYKKWNKHNKFLFYTNRLLEFYDKIKDKYPYNWFVLMYEKAIVLEKLNKTQAAFDLYKKLFYFYNNNTFSKKDKEKLKKIYESIKKKLKED